MSLRLARIRPLLSACTPNTRPAFQAAQTTAAYSSKSARKRRRSNTTAATDPVPSPSPASDPSVSLKKPSNSQQKDRNESKSHQRTNGSPKQPRSLRPLTLLLICIPLGYVFRWYTSDSSPTSPRNARTPDGFTKYTLLAREFISPTLAIFTLAPASPGTGISNLTGPTQGKDGEGREDDFPVKIESVEVKQPLLQIARQYTLLPPALPRTTESNSSSDGRAEHSTAEEHVLEEDELRLLVRREDRGEVSGYLFRLGIGSEVQIRGPNIEFGLRSSDLRKDGGGLGNVLFLAGGTGVATAMGLVGSMSEAKGGVNSDVRLLWAVRRREECLGGHSETGETSKGWFSWFWKTDEQTFSGPPVEDTRFGRQKGTIVKQLEDLQSRFEASPGTGKLSLNYYVDEENSFIRPGEVSALVKKTDEGALPGKRNLIVVSGPEGFVKYWAGPKVWDQRRELQGPLGGVLAQMDLKGWDVLKL